MKLADDSATAGRASPNLAPVITDCIDRLITVEMRNRGMPNGKIGPLYEAARAEGGGLPLVYRAAQGLIGAVRRGDTVFIVTGAASGPLMPKGETTDPSVAPSLRAPSSGAWAPYPSWCVKRSTSIQSSPLVRQSGLESAASR